MGYSCSMLASKRLDLIQNLCFKSTGLSNVWIDNNQKFMFEIGRENKDGSITGTIYKYTNDNLVKRTSNFKINKDGSVCRGPKFFKNKAFLIVLVEQRAKFPVNVLDYIPTEEELDKIRLDANKEYSPNGINYHISESLGYMPYVNKVLVIDLDQNDQLSLYGKKIVKIHNMPMFETC